MDPRAGELRLDPGISLSADALNDAVMVETLLRQAGTRGVFRSKQRRLMRAAVRVARSRLPREALKLGGLREKGSARTHVDVLRLLAERIEHAGELAVARDILESLAGLELSKIDAARVLADRARNSRRLDRPDLARAQYEELRRVGGRLKSNELKARALIGLASMAQTSGNFPEMERLSQSGVRLALDAGFSRLAAIGEIGLGVRAGTARDYSAAIEHLWRAYRLSKGDPRLTSEVLGNLAHALYESGWPTEARNAAALVLRRPLSIRLTASILGTYVLACGELRDRAAVDWAAKAAMKWTRLTGHARDLAGVFYDCAVAYARMGAEAQSSVLLQRAKRLAKEHGFHDIAHRIDQMPAAPRKHPLAPAAEAVGHELARIAEEAGADPRELVLSGHDALQT